MTGLALFNPLRRLAHVDPFARDMDDFFKGGFFAPLNFNTASMSQFPVDVTEDDKNYKVRAEIPGFRKEDIQVSVDGDRVSISGETKKEDEEKKDGEVVFSECYYGKQYRSFTLPQAVDKDKTSAKYQDGVLNLVLPKKGHGSSQKIAIQ